ncbi:MAG: DEAD/DEAH box helicase family protein [Anaerolineae bacterium]|nr:DEAD/DEAH box helicase family protein [Anaerolineae bacterium]
MRDVIVALDLETTGLNKDEDSIIEIGAARFQDGELLDTFDTLVDPGCSVPERVTALTGIRSEDLINAPRVRDVLGDLRRFIGSAPLVGHRIEFDLGFLARYDVGMTNPALDTYELASVLLPTTPRYNLTHLTGLLGLDLEHAHRALDDAIATGRLYWALWQRIMDLPLGTLEEIVEAAHTLDWGAKQAFLAAYQERSRTALIDGQPRTGERKTISLFELFKPFTAGWEVLRPRDDHRRLSVDGLAALIEPGGQLEHTFPGYESRPQQVEMLRAVTEALNDDEHILIEAPTGVGKSLAYLVPAAYWAAENGECVVISTATINLQDQLIKHDLPLLADGLDLSFRAAVLKGRANYLCPRRLTTLRRRGPTSVAELRVLAKILVWRLESDSGDKGEITLRGFEENAVWARLSAADEGCTMDRCKDQMHGACPFYRARVEAESAHIVVVNHALLLADVQIGNRVLPDYRYLIIDEAHHLEDATTNGLSFQITRVALQRQLDDLGDRRRGMLSDVIYSTRGSVPGQYFTEIESYVETVSDAVGAMSVHVGNFFTTLYNFLEDEGLLKRYEYSNLVRITPQLRERPGWTHVEQAWEVLGQFATGIADAMKRLAKGLNNLRSFDVPDFDDLLLSVQAAARHLDTAQHQLGAFAVEPEDNTVYWAEVGQDRERLSVHAAPLNVGPLLEEYLWSFKRSVVLTSATLRTAGTFDYISDRLNAHAMKTLVVGSPFDYERSTLIYIPTDMPSPDQRDDYQRGIERGLIELAAATNGRLLGLFTSYSQLRQTAQAIAPRLALGDITVFDQSGGTSRQGLLDGFKQTEKAVLLGTRSFWEGVDIPGDDLSVLAIARLPFAVPSDPIFAARSEMFDNSFTQYAVPDAILRFRQGFGRLIRTKTDRGVVVLFDNRVISKWYGRLFLDSLPTCTVRRGSLDELPRVAARWIDG